MLEDSLEQYCKKEKMKIKLTLLVLIILQLSCKNDSEKHNKTGKDQIQKIEIETQKKKTITFEFEKFKISKGEIGDIKIGMNIIDAEKELDNLTKEEADAYSFGFDGGGNAYIYSFKNQPILALVPNYLEKIIAIIALNKNLRTNNGLNPKSKISEIQSKYPNIEIHLDEMMDWEGMYDEKNKWGFIFMTEENNRIGKYKDIYMPTVPIRTETKMNWILIN